MSLYSFTVFPCLLFLGCIPSGLASSFTSEITDRNISIGVTIIKLTKECFQISSSYEVKEVSGMETALSFLNLHENENTSVVAARSYLSRNGGCLVKFDNGYSRTVSFQLSDNGEVYTVDPNRIFTKEGIIDTLNTYGRSHHMSVYVYI